LFLGAIQQTLVIYKHPKDCKLYFQRCEGFQPYIGS
jgi:hypothetical protein